MKDGEVNQEYVVKEAGKALEEDGVQFEQKELESDVAACATQSKM